MTFTEKLIQRLQETQGDTLAQAFVTAEFLLKAHPEAEQKQLHAALDAASVLRWFDIELLAKLLEITKHEARQRFDILRQFPFIERYRRGDEGPHNVHESTRLGWRMQLASHNRPYFRALSMRAAEYFAEDSNPAGRIEWVYQLLCGDPERGATELENLYYDWISRAHMEDRYALGTALYELEATRVVEGRARIWVLLVSARARDLMGETAQLVDIGSQLLPLARQAGDERAEAETMCLVGDICEVRGDFKAALTEFDQYLKLCQKYTSLHGSDTHWQRHLAVAHNRIGGVLEALGELRAAREAFENDLIICQRLVDRNPSYSGWQRELAAAYNRIGGVLEAMGELKAAREAFVASLQIIKRLSDSDSSHAVWQRDLAVAHNRVGGVLETLGNLTAAQKEFEKDLTISLLLAGRDPSHPGWQRDLAAANRRLGDVLQARGKLEAARAKYAETLAISRRLAEHDPTNADWQRNLALGCHRMARIEQATGRSDTALPLLIESSRIFSGLVANSPGFSEWAQEKRAVEEDLAACRLLAGYEAI